MLAKNQHPSCISRSKNNYFIGRLIEEKGFDLLIEAFKIVQKKYKNLRLVILGIGKLKEDLDTQIMLSNLENKVILKGFVRNVYPYFKNAEACVVSSRIEGFPNVLLQMMSQNNSVISTLCADGINELKGVEIAQVNDVKSLSNAILKSLSQNSSNNRNRFDKEIESRSINLFIKKIGTKYGKLE